MKSTRRGMLRTAGVSIIAMTALAAGAASAAAQTIALVQINQQALFFN